MKNVALFLCMTFVGSMALTATSFAKTSASEGWGTVNICQEKPCPKDCKCDKCTKDKDGKCAKDCKCDKCTKAADNKSCCAKDNKDAKSCSKSEAGCEKKCEKSDSKTTETQTTEPAKK